MSLETLLLMPLLNSFLIVLCYETFIYVFVIIIVIGFLS